MRNRNMVHLFKGIYNFRHTIGRTGSQIEHLYPIMLQNICNRLNMTLCQIYNVNIVPAAGAVRCIIIISENRQLFSAAFRTPAAISRRA